MNIIIRSYVFFLIQFPNTHIFIIIYHFPLCQYTAQNRITRLPESIGNLKFLIDFDASQNLLEELPETMGKLNSLLNLILFQNKLKKLSNSSLREKYLNLRKLIVHTNKLSSVHGLENIESLETLDLSSNDFNDSKLYVSFIYLRNMKHLSVRNTGLEELPNDISAMSNLQFIDARNNKLEKLPTKIGHLRNLKDLYVAGNSICSNMNNEEIMIAYDLPNGINKMALCTKQCATTCLNKHLSDNICDDPSIVSFSRAVDPAFRYAFTSSLSIRPNKTEHRQYNYASGRGCNVAACQYDKGDCL